jgi:hypothetical protein
VNPSEKTVSTRDTIAASRRGVFLGFFLKSRLLTCWEFLGKSASYLFRKTCPKLVTADFSVPSSVIECDESDDFRGDVILHTAFPHKEPSFPGPLGARLFRVLFDILDQQEKVKRVSRALDKAVLFVPVTDLHVFGVNQYCAHSDFPADVECPF